MTKKTNIQKPDSVSQDVWDGFLELRKARRAPVTALVIKRFTTESALAGMTLEQAFVECVDRSWTGFKSEWVKKETTNHLRHVDSAEMYEDYIPDGLR